MSGNGAEGLTGTCFRAILCIKCVSRNGIWGAINLLEGVTPHMRCVSRNYDLTTLQRETNRETFGKVYE